MVDVERCPTCGWPAIKGSLCPRCAAPLPGQSGSSSPPGARRASTDSNSPGIAIIVLLVFLGIFWIVVAALQIGIGLRIRLGGVALLIAIVGFWNLLVGGYTLSAIRGVVTRSYHAPGALVLISVGSAAWGIFATIWLGGWLQPLAIPLSIALGIVTWANHSYFDAGRPQERPPVRAFALTHDRGIEEASPVCLPAPSPPPPWEQPLSDANQSEGSATTSPSPEAAGCCIRCGDRAVADSAFCRACDARLIAPSTAQGPPRSGRYR
jgi:hypothetical protein